LFLRQGKTRDGRKQHGGKDEFTHGPPKDGCFALQALSLEKRRQDQPPPRTLASAS
jgi:hypothetical protein